MVGANRASRTSTSNSPPTTFSQIGKRRLRLGGGGVGASGAWPGAVGVGSGSVMARRIVSQPPDERHTLPVECVRPVVAAAAGANPPRVPDNGAGRARAADEAELRDRIAGAIGKAE